MSNNLWKAFGPLSHPGLVVGIRNVHFTAHLEGGSSGRDGVLNFRARRWLYYSGLTALTWGPDKSPRIEALRYPGYENPDQAGPSSLNHANTVLSRRQSSHATTRSVVQDMVRHGWVEVYQYKSGRWRSATYQLVESYRLQAFYSEDKGWQLRTADDTVYARGRQPQGSGLRYQNRDVGKWGSQLKEIEQAAEAIYSVLDLANNAWLQGKLAPAATAAFALSEEAYDLVTLGGALNNVAEPGLKQARSLEIQGRLTEIRNTLRQAAEAASAIMLSRPDPDPNVADALESVHAANAAIGSLPPTPSEIILNALSEATPAKVQS